MNRMERRVQNGFTIVELLIVIVVIAILAAISIVAYNGVQSRARESSTMSDLANISKQIEVYNAANGSYPNSVAAATSIGARTSIQYGGSRVLLCATASTGFAVFIYDTTLDRQYRVMSGSSPRELVPKLTWSSAPLCGSTPYSPVGWGDYWLAS